MIAMKIFDDIFMRNSDYAIIGGVTVEELNCMEHEFLALIDFDLHIREGDYNNYCSKLHKFGARKIREKKISPCSDKELPLASTYESPKKIIRESLVGDANLKLIIELRFGHMNSVGIP
eukprot:TRINITY_DN2180_c0_g1_i9.p1 TRINITY_DN2180_c0_g1~~TRINITY_DN2180_c0_g1_i9.p1  ORF type:complete len:119 (+),score=20.84 TRINITY_DN2180_c0_g1_i9:559-915(+)